MFGLPKIEIGDGFSRQVNVTDGYIAVLGKRFNDFREPLVFCLGHIIIPSIAENFAVQGRPTWEPLAAGTIENRSYGVNSLFYMAGPHAILYRTGRMFDVVTDPNTWSISKDTVQLESLVSEVPYSAYHQFGTSKMPARPFVMFQAQDVEKIMETFEFWVDHIIEEEWGFGSGSGFEGMI
jgi:phage gpG-like protein